MNKKINNKMSNRHKKKRLVTRALVMTLFIALFTQFAQAQSEILKEKGTTAEEVVYTLDGTITGGSDGYATESDITQNGKSWKVTGNTTVNPWRIGGNRLNSVGRPLYSTSQFSDNISKIVVTHGSASNITVNSMTLTVSANADFSNPTSTLTGTFSTNGSTTFERPSGVDWSNKYFRIVYTVTVSGGTNRYLQFTKAEFYKETSAEQCTKTIPYTYGFEDASEFSCWSAVDCETDQSQGYSGIVSASSSDPAHSGSKMFSISSYDGNTAPQYLISPALTGVANGVHVEFYYKNVSYSSAPETFEVGYSTTNSNVSSFTWVDSKTCTSTSAYQHFTANYMGIVKYVAVKYTTQNSYYLLLDDFTFEEVPSCLEPTNVIASNETTTSATISWTAGGSETEWDIYFTTNHSDVPTASTTPSFSGLSTNSFNTITNNYTLTPATTYYVYVRSACSSSDISAWSTPCIFNTECEGMTLPYSETFEAGALTVCWNIINDSPVYMNSEVATTAPYAGTYHLSLRRGTSSGNQIVVLPEVASTYTLSNYEVSFYARLYASGNNETTTNRTLAVGVMTDPDDPSTFVQVGSAVTPTASYAQYTFDLSSYTGNGQYIAIQHTSTSNGHTFIDNLEVTALPCPVPSGLSATPTASTASLRWTGYQSSYNVRYRTVTLGDPTTTTEGFEHSGSMPDGWTKLDLGDGNNTSELGVYNNSTYAGDYCFRFSSYSGSSSGSFDQYLISPELNNISALSFYYRSSSTYTSGETFRVGYSTTTNDVSAFTWVSNGTTSSTSYSQFTASNIPANAKYFAINYTAVYQYRLYIDDITYTYTPATFGAWENKTNQTSPLNITGLTPLTDYEWQVQGVNCDGNGTPTDWSATATFTTLNGFTVTATADPTGSGTIAFTGSGVISSDATSAQVNPNGDVTVTATAAAGYTFMNWVEGGSVVSTTNAYALTGVNASHNLTAHFVDMTSSNTWPAAVTTLAAATPGYSESGDNITISNANGLAWLISTVNGLNGQTAAFSGKTITLTADVDMSAHIWVPIGTAERPFTCTFNGNGHTIVGVTRSIEFPHNGLFGYVGGAANIQNVVVQTELTGNSLTAGAIAGTFASTGTISNVEGAGTLAGGALTTSMGGLVGNTTDGTVHSSFAVNTMTATNTTTQMGGLVGYNAGDLLNSYANTTMSGSNHIGGLVGKNNGRVENCYSVIGSNIFPAFARENAEGGVISYCYTDQPNGYVATTAGGTPTPILQGHGTYTSTQNTHTYGYMYSDNAVELVSGETNSYVVDEIVYKKLNPSSDDSPTITIDKWPGLLSTLNQWVAANNSTVTYTSWFRPTTKNINDDLPVLCFPSDIVMASTDGKFLDYGTGLDAHLTKFNTQTQTTHLFLYKNAVDVEEVPEDHVNVYINEDVVLKQAAGADEFINTQVGVSFDNSCGSATDFFEQPLIYDWHMFSTPLADAPLGISYSNDSINPWTMNSQANQVTGVVNSYLPDGTGNVSHWDLYSFYEPEYHWINLKRNSASHHHFDEPYDHIVYQNEDELVPGKGYMAAIDLDTYLCNKGTLNGPSNSVSITLTKQSDAPDGVNDELGYNLLGNPYQAYFDVTAFLTANSAKVESSYWVYIAESDNYVAGNVRASANPVLPSSTLHPHQGFFVLAKDDNQEVTFNYSTMALATPVSDSYFRGDKVNYPLVNLFATSEKGKKDLAVIEFNRPETGGSKKMRAINNADFELAAHANGQRYSILFTEEGVEKVPVHFRTNEEGTFTMTWSTYHGHFTSLFLVDNLTGTRTDMLRTDSYTFTSTPDDYTARFYITFRCTGVEEYTEGGENFAWYDGNDWIVDGKGQLQLFDVLGHVLQSQYVDGEQNRLDLEGYAAGVYMLHLTDGKTAKVQKIVVR